MTTQRASLLILSFTEIEKDARVLKQVNHFAEKYDVTTCGLGKQPHPSVHHIELDPQQRKYSRFDLIFRRYRKMYWQDPTIIEAQKKLSASGSYDMIMANDLETIGLALSLTPQLGVHADLHEYSPRLNEEILVWRLFLAPFMNWQGKKFLKRIASSTTVSSGLAREYEKQFGIKPQIVTNAPPLANLSAQPVSEPLRIVHSGAALRNRHLDKTIAAVQSAHASVTLDLYLMPNDAEYLAELEELIADNENIRLFPPVPYSELINTLNGYDLGIHVIPPTNFNNRWALPNKFFDYVQARLGLIIGPSSEMRNILQEYNLGVVASDFSVGAITKVIDSLTPDQVTEWKYSSETASAVLSAAPQLKIWEDALTKLGSGGKR